MSYAAMILLRKILIYFLFDYLFYLINNITSNIYFLGWNYYYLDGLEPIGNQTLYLTYIVRVISTH